jgi:putative transposase
MADLFLLSRVQMWRIERYLPTLAWDRAGGRWADRPRHRVYNHERTVLARCSARLWPAQADNRFVRWSHLGVFNKIFAELARKGSKPERIMKGAAHRRQRESPAELHGCIAKQSV